MMDAPPSPGSLSDDEESVYEIDSLSAACYHEAVSYINSAEGLVLPPYQIDAITRISDTLTNPRLRDITRGVIEWGKTGSGKTFVTILAALRVVEKQWREDMTGPAVILVVFPSIGGELCRHWKKELSRCGQDNVFSYSKSGCKGFEEWSKKVREDNGMRVYWCLATNGEIRNSVHPPERGRPFDADRCYNGNSLFIRTNWTLIIQDECHNNRNGTDRFDADENVDKKKPIFYSLFRVVRSSPDAKTILATGTPVWNSYVDWHCLVVLCAKTLRRPVVDKKVLMNMDTFSRNGGQEKKFESAYHEWKTTILSELVVKVMVPADFNDMCIEKTVLTCTLSKQEYELHVKRIPDLEESVRQYKEFMVWFNELSADQRRVHKEQQASLYLSFVANVTLMRALSLYPHGFEPIPKHIPDEDKDVEKELAILLERTQAARDGARTAREEGDKNTAIELMDSIKGELKKIQELKTRKLKWKPVPLTDEDVFSFKLPMCSLFSCVANNLKKMFSETPNQRHLISLTYSRPAECLGVYFREEFKGRLVVVHHSGVNRSKVMESFLSNEGSICITTAGSIREGYDLFPTTEHLGVHSAIVFHMLDYRLSQAEEDQLLGRTRRKLAQPGVTKWQYFFYRQQYEDLQGFWSPLHSICEYKEGISDPLLDVEELEEAENREVARGRLLSDKFGLATVGAMSTFCEMWKDRITVKPRKRARRE